MSCTVSFLLCHYHRGPRLTTENMTVDNNNDTESPKARSDRINQREEIRCGENNVQESG